MAGGFAKGLGAAIIATMTYINSTFSPLIWLLVLLVALDLIMNAHQESKQFEKMGSMVFSLGMPTYISQHMNDPALVKYIVAVLALVYLRIVVPQLMERVSKFRFSKDPVQNKADQATVDAVLAALETKGEKEIQQFTAEQSAAVAGTGAKDVIKKG